MIYNQKIEQFVDFVDWTENDPCIWVVYPFGCMGDLVSSIINFHYVSTGAKCMGIADNGQVIFRDSNGKQYNMSNAKIDSSILDFVQDHLSAQNLNYSTIDQIIFSNHSYQENAVKDILNFFPKSKIVRILPKNLEEARIAKWLGLYKNVGNVYAMGGYEEEYHTSMYKLNINHPRLIELNFSDIIHKNKFDAAYDKIVNLLELEYKLIRYDFIEYYLSKQHTDIRPALLKLTEN